jgi:hypothetical protein
VFEINASNKTTDKSVIIDGSNVAWHSVAQEVDDKPSAKKYDMS